MGRVPKIELQFRWIHSFILASLGFEFFANPMKYQLLVLLIVSVIIGCKSSVTGVNGNGPLLNQTRYLFIGADTAQGNGGVILRSSDDGLTWARSDSGLF